MIKEFEFFHGVVFSKMLHGNKRKVSIRSLDSADNSSYCVDESIGLYIKYCSKRMTRWRFTFKKEHQNEIYKMKASFKEVYLLLVCNDDGIVCLSYKELKKILDEEHGQVEWISASRNKREMYAIKGSDGVLDFKVSPNDFPNKIFKNLQKSKGILNWFSN